MLETEADVVGEPLASTSTVGVAVVPGTEVDVVRASVYDDVVYSPGLEFPAGGAGTEETGQMVVDRGIVSVVNLPVTGQSVTVGGQEVTV